MDVHPAKNGINRYWSIPIWKKNTWESRGQKTWKTNETCQPHLANHHFPVSLWSATSHTWIPWEDSSWSPTEVLDLQLRRQLRTGSLPQNSCGRWWSSPLHSLFFFGWSTNPMVVLDGWTPFNPSSFVGWSMKTTDSCGLTRLTH